MSELHIPPDFDIAQHRDEVLKALTAAWHALRSYELGNSDPGLATRTAYHIEQMVKGAIQ